jgi:hypothetical protein
MREPNSFFECRCIEGTTRNKVGNKGINEIGIPFREGNNVEQIYLLGDLSQAHNIIEY